MTLKVVIKQQKDIEERKLTDVKFYTIDKQHVDIVYNDSRNHRFKLGTVLEILELPWFQKSKYKI